MIVKTEKQLRKTTRDFDFKKDEIFKVKEELIDAMWLESGLGVSANQLGHDVRVFAMRGEKKEDSLVCVNPKIEDFSENMNTMGMNLTQC